MALDHGRPIQIKQNVFSDFEEMTDGDMAYVANLILEEFAKDDTGPGSININGDGTSIGTFIDTRYTGVTVGVHPVDSDDITEINYVFKQNLNEVTLTEGTDYVPPVVFDSGNTDFRTVDDGRDETEFPTPQIGIQAMDIGQIKSTIIDKCLGKLSSGGVGSYYIGSTAPDDGGTWKIIGSFTDTSLDDTVGSSDIETEVTYNLYRKTDDNATYVVRRPLYLRSDDDLSEMSDGDIKDMKSILQYYIQTTGIGQYALQENAPAVGTWTAVGSSSDKRQDEGNISYTGFFTGQYTGSYTASYTGTYQTTYTGTYTRQYAGSYSGYYTTDYSGSYSGSYSGTYRKTFTGYYTGNYKRLYAGTHGFLRYYGGYSRYWTGTHNYTRFWQSTATKKFTRSSTGTYTGSYTGDYTRAYQGTYSGTYGSGVNKNYVGNYSGNYIRNYSGTYSGNYAQFFTGATVLQQEITVSGTPVTLWQRTA